MQTSLASYFSVNPNTITVTHVPTTSSYTTFLVQFTDTTLLGSSTKISAAYMAYQVADYYYNNLYYSMRDWNFQVSDATLDYFPANNKDAPTSVYLTVYRLYSSMTYDTNTLVVQTLLKNYFSVPASTITVSSYNSTSYYTTYYVTFTDTTSTASGSQPVSAATMAYALTNYNNNGLVSQFNGVNMGVYAATTDTTGGSEKSKVPIIVGVIIGVVVLIAIIAFIANRQSKGTGRSDQDYVAMGGKPMV